MAPQTQPSIPASSPSSAGFNGTGPATGTDKPAPNPDPMSMFGAFNQQMPNTGDLYSMGLNLMNNSSKSLLTYNSTFTATLMKTWNPILAHLAAMRSAFDTQMPLEQ